MAGGPKLFDYRMTEKEYILAETIIEMTDKSELFCTGLEHFDWSEIEVIPTGDRPHDFSYTLKQEAWIELIDAVAAYITSCTQSGVRRTGIPQRTRKTLKMLSVCISKWPESVPKAVADRLHCFPHHLLKSCPVKF